MIQASEVVVELLPIVYFQKTQLFDDFILLVFHHLKCVPMLPVLVLQLMF